jgi:hypothetical protein
MIAQHPQKRRVVGGIFDNHVFTVYIQTQHVESPKKINTKGSIQKGQFKVEEAKSDGDSCTVARARQPKPVMVARRRQFFAYLRVRNRR